MSCREIRRLFWQLVLVVERKAVVLLRWSHWRRWHQAWARFYHYRTRESVRRAGAVHQATAPKAAVVDQVWQRLEQELPPARRKGRPYAHDRRVVLAAIVYVMETGCAWHTLPSHFPPWQTVYAQLVRWRRTGIWDMIWTEVEQPRATA